jgi:hypothetical protein
MYFDESSTLKGVGPSSRAPTPLDVIVEKLSKPSVKPAEATGGAINQDLMVIDEPE